MGGMEPNSKERTWIDFSIEGRDIVWKRSFRMSRTLSAIAWSSFDQSRSTDMVCRSVEWRRKGEVVRRRGIVGMLFDDHEVCVVI